MHRYFATLALTLLFGACATTPSVPTADPTYSGRIVEVTPASEYEGSAPDVVAVVWVRESSDPECGIRFTLQSDVEVFEGSEPASLEALRPGRTADVWFDSPVLTSCPAQAGADVVRVR